jgi:nitrite reductase (NO-forming)/hydroxylamine reductase
MQSLKNSLRNSISILTIVFVGLALSLQACSPDTGTEQTVATSDEPVVHEAEAAAGQIAETLADGEAVYNANCAACHQTTGVGLAGAFPPLAGSDYLMGDRKQVLTAALFGLSGPITVNGQEYDGVMPSMGYLSDADLAAALSYVFSAWGNTGSAVSVEEVAALRAELGQEDRAAGERHTGATEGELRYRGTPSPLFRTLRRLPRRIAQRRNRQTVDS